MRIIIDVDDVNHQATIKIGRCVLAQTSPCASEKAAVFLAARLLETCYVNPTKSLPSDLRVENGTWTGRRAA